MATRRSLTGSSSSAIKSHNLRAILLTMLQHGQVSRVRIAKLTGLSTTTVTNLITELLDHGVVEENGTEQHRGVGRPRTALRLVPDSRFAIGIHIGVGSVRVAMADLYAHPVCTFQLDHDIEQPAENVLHQVYAMTERCIVESGADPKNIIGVGVGASGLVNPYTGVNVLAPNLGWHNIPLRDWFAERLELPVFVDNNVRAMALAEAMFGAAKDVYVLAFVYARIGVGAGFVVGGQLYRGGAGAGEIGHVTILVENGTPCRCGNTGCLETLVSEPVILRQAEAIANADRSGILAQHLKCQDQPIIERVFEAARAGDVATKAMLDERAYYMGLGLANLVNTLSPEMIILGGIFAQGKDLLFPTVEHTLRQRAFANLGEQIVLRPPTFGPNPGVVGAASLALDAFFYEQSEVTF
jgi:predicted NBD/HSP70 family sugar kinase/biotin operon repressor